MAIGIVIKKKQERMGIIRNASQAARHHVSRENRQEYDNEKRAIELHRKMPCGHPDAKAVAVAKMMGIQESTAKKYIQKDLKGQSKVVLDGKID